MSDDFKPEDINILVVDDEPDIIRLFKDYLTELDFRVRTATSSRVALNIFSEEAIDIVFLDINMPRISGLKLLQSFKKQNPDVIIIMVSAVQEIDIVVRCIQLGAYDYLVKPIIDLNQLKIRIERALSEQRIKKENINLRRELAVQTGVPAISSNSVSMKKVLDMIHTVAKYDTTVLLSGESGTGKEVAARTIHNYSHRSTNPFIAVNCGSIPESLLESTLFGYEKGAFTGAIKRNIGWFEESNHGTIFLDEITETNQEFQTQLLRVLEDNQIRRVGGSREIELNLRIIAATNQDCEQLVNAGKFREDLYYRLNVFHIILPPLRERREDISVIANYHLDRLGKKYGKENTRLSPEVLELFNKLEWKGNIRELINVIENALIMCRSNTIFLNDLPAQFRNQEQLEITKTTRTENYQSAKKNFERQYFSDILRRENGNISKAAKVAGLSRQHFHLKIRNLELK